MIARRGEGTESAGAACKPLAAPAPWTDLLIDILGAKVPRPFCDECDEPVNMDDRTDKDCAKGILCSSCGGTFVRIRDLFPCQDVEVNRRIELVAQANGVPAGTTDHIGDLENVAAVKDHRRAAKEQWRNFE